MNKRAKQPVETVRAGEPDHLANRGIEQPGPGAQRAVLVPAGDALDDLPALQLAEGGAQGGMPIVQGERNHVDRS